MEGFDPIEVSWGDGISSQNSFSDESNPYNHLQANHKKSKDISSKEIETKIAFRGVENQAPQKDIALGKGSVTHRTISEQLSYLTAGTGFKFKAKDEDESESIEVVNEIEKASKWLEMGLDDSRKTLANGIVYHSLSSIIVSQNKPEAQMKEDEVVIANEPIRFAAVQSERLRFSVPVLNQEIREIVEYHLYHDTWRKETKRRHRCSENCNCRKNVFIPEMIPLEKYVETQNQKDYGYYVLSCDNSQSKLEKYVSFAVMPQKGIFDNFYPLPTWKTNTSINDIQSETESSNIRIDFLRNGLHVFAIVNVYAKHFKELVAPGKKTLDADWADTLSVVKNLKKSYNSGKIIINPLGTDNAEKDGLIEVQEVNLTFPHEAYKFFNEQSRSTILTAHGVAADLFGITKSEGSNLRSQEGYMKIAIMMLAQKVSILQQTICDSIDKMLEYYGCKKIKTYIENHDSNMLLLVMSEISKSFMTVNEFRAQVLGLQNLDPEDFKDILQFKESKNEAQENNNSEAE